MRILLLNPPSLDGKPMVRDTLYGCWHKTKCNYMWPPLALMYISAVVEAKNPSEEVKIIDTQVEKTSFTKLLEQIEYEQPDIVGMITDGLTISQDSVVLKKIKEVVPDVFDVLMGGIATTNPYEVLRLSGANCVIRGEPELVFAELVKNRAEVKKLKLVSGVSFISGSVLINNPLRRPIQKLDLLPFPDRNKVPLKEYVNPLSKEKYSTTILSSRGCPYSCTFCTASLVYGRTHRARTAKNVVDEMERVWDCFGIRDFFFRDENITLSRKHMTSICKEIQNRGLDVAWMCNSRADTVDYRTLDYMKKSGCYLIKFGVESGSQQTLHRIKKGITIEKIQKTFNATKELGIETVAHFIFGFKWETKGDAKNTIAFAKEIDPDYALFDILRLSLGTKIFEEIRGPKKSFTQTFANKEAYEQPDYASESYDKAYAEFYLRPSKLATILKKPGIRYLLDSGLDYISRRINNKHPN